MWGKIREKLKGWKTMIAAGVYGLAGTLLEFHDNILAWIGASGVDWKSLVPADWLPYLLIGSAILFGYLRYISTGPVGSKGEQPATPQTKAGD